MKSLLITGAAGGIGGALVRRALDRGERVAATVLSPAEAQSLAPHPNLRVLLMDVGSTASVTAAFAELDAFLGGATLDVVIHCAALCPLGAFEVQPIEVIEQVLNVNASGSARVLRESLPRLRGHDGRIVLLSSLWGKAGGPMLSAYCASKHAIEAIADCTRRETQGQNLHIVVVEPGAINTDIPKRQLEGARRAADALSATHRPLYEKLYRAYAKLIEKNLDGATSAEACAEGIERAAFTSRPAARYRVGGDAKAVTTLARLLPDRALDGLFRSMLK